MPTIVPGRDDPLVASDVVRHERAEILASWAELCRWDPTLPPESVPLDGAPLVDAVALALGRPQPIGWGADPDVEEAALAFAAEAGSVTVALGQLACLREAISRRLRGRLPWEQLEETWARLGVVLDRAIAVAASRTVRQLEEDARTDALTGLGNRRTLERDLARELARSARHHRRFSLALLDLDGLKRINDTHGHDAGDAVLQAVGVGLRESLRAGDSAYRLGGDEFALLLPETSRAQAAVLLQRLVDAGAPPFSWGAAAFPDDGRSAKTLLNVADTRMYERKANRRSS